MLKLYSYFCDMLNNYSFFNILYGKKSSQLRCTIFSKNRFMRPSAPPNSNLPPNSAHHLHTKFGNRPLGRAINSKQHGLTPCFFMLLSIRPLGGQQPKGLCHPERMQVRVRIHHWIATLRSQ